MVEFKDTTNKAKALTLAKYIRAGQKDADCASDSYFSGQRWHHMLKQWRRLRCYNTPENVNDLDIEVYYVRFVSHHCVDHLVNLGLWKPLLEIVAERLDFYASNDKAISTLTITTLGRLLAVAWALQHNN